MTVFKKAIQMPKTPSAAMTANGGKTFDTSGNPLVDLFSAIGSSRGKNLVPQFLAAYDFDRTLALKILLWGRDIRGGAGERQVIRDLLVALEGIHPHDAEMLIPLVPFFGRWDDILVFKTKEMREKAYSVIAEGLDDPATAGLVAKWMPRKGMIALELEAFLGLQPKSKNFAYTEGKNAFPSRAYRRKLSELTNVVETLMSQKKWDDIKFDHVPSLAAARYQKAFNKHCAERYKAYKDGLVKGTTKINASAVYPYDVIKSVRMGDQDVANAQWEALPNYLDDSLALAVVDVSASMDQPAGGYGSKSVVTCKDVSTSLGLYLATKARGPFKDCYLTFSGQSKINVLKGKTIGEKYRYMLGSDTHWSMNTNVASAFDEILRIGKQHGVADADMPKILLILSDMEFDGCVQGSQGVTAYDMAKKKYEDAGYSIPRIVFWNLNARSGNSPVTIRDNGTALVSGFSPSIMKSILSANIDDFTPETVMLETINNPRYDVIAPIE